MSKVLVSYFSASGVTRGVAQRIATAIEGDIFEIEPVEKYTNEDLNWMNKQSRSSIEMNENIKPDIASKVSNLAEYDTICLGFPIWWYKEPTIIDKFLEENKIEDEYSLADAVAETLKSENFNVCIKTNGEDGEDEALTENYDLILLDVMLPKKNGFEILNYLRQEKIKTPIIMLTAKSEIDDKLNGLEHGADDYITKPFSMRELMARIKAVLKRTNNIEDTNF